MSEKLKRRLFWVVARTCLALYRWFPLFGSLRASIAIIQSNSRFLVVERNDGRGLSLPGGIARRGETEEEALRREVLEETGLSVTARQLRIRYHSTADVPCSIFVFVAQASGELKSSWEGALRWMSVDEIETHILDSQRPIIEVLRSLKIEARRSCG